MGVIYMNEDKKSFIILSLGFAIVLSIAFILFNIRGNAELLVDYSFIKDILFYLFILFSISVLFKLIERFYKICQIKKNVIQYIFQIFFMSLFMFLMISFVLNNLFYLFIVRLYSFSILLDSYRVHFYSILVLMIFYLFLLCIVGYLGYQKQDC